MASIQTTIESLTEPRRQVKDLSRRHQQFIARIEELSVPGAFDRANDSPERRALREQRRQLDLKDTREQLDALEEEIIQAADAWEEAGHSALERALDEPVTITPQEYGQIPPVQLQHIKDQAQSLPADELLRQLRHVMDEDDRVGQKLYLSYARDRRMPEGVSTEEKQAEREVQATLTRIAEGLADPNVAKLSESAHELVQKASELRTSTRRWKAENRRAFGLREPVA